MNMVCETVKDLIPLYIDGTSSKSTNKFVKKHIKKCHACAGYYHMCQHSKDMAEKRNKENLGDTDLVFIPENGYKLIAERVSKSILIERIMFISAVVAAIVTTALIFIIKSKKDK